MTVAEAMDALTRSPDFWKVALVEGQAFPLLDQIETDVRLFETKRAGQDALRDREKELVADGFKRRGGALSRGFIQLVRGDDIIALGLDYPGRVAPLA